MQGSFCLESRHTKTYNIYKETFTDTLIEKITIKYYFEIPFLPNDQGHMLSSNLAAWTLTHWKCVLETLAEPWAKYTNVKFNCCVKS